MFDKRDSGALIGTNNVQIGNVSMSIGAVTAPRSSGQLL